MNDLPRHTLSRIIAERGREICDEPKRVEALLRDLCGAHRREINIIAGALEERVAADLIAAGKSVPREVLLARLAARLRDNLAYTPEAARWGVEAWAVALGVLSEAELRERARAESEQDAPLAAPSPARAPQPPTANPARVTPQAPTPRGGTIHAPTPPQPRPTTTSRAQPPAVRPPAPVPAPLPTTHPHANVPQPQRQHVPPPPSRQDTRRGLSLRGCFVVVVLIVLLFVAAVFVVPFVIGILQEEQARPSINEPRVR
jgi:hypothetical protein